MLRAYLFLPLGLCIGMNVSAMDCSCDCTHWPWDDACDKCCSLNVLNNSSRVELHSFLGLDDKTATQLSSFKAKSGKIDSLDQVKDVLNKAKLKVMHEQIQDLPPLEREYVLSSPQEKSKLADKLAEPCQAK